MIHASFPDMGRLSADVAQRFNEQRRGLLTAIGAALLSRVQLAYVEKARHGTGDDGIRWDELQRSTLANRVRKRGPGRQIVQQIKALQAELRALRGTRSQRPRRAANRSASARTARQPRAAREPRQRIEREHVKAATGKAAEILQLRYRIQELRRRLESLIDQAVARHEIGVDTGLQRAAAAPGYIDNVWNRTPNDGRGGNEFVVTDASVTVGYQRSYSEYFDAHRPLMPEVIPDAWMQGFERQAEEVYGAIVHDSFDRLGGL